MALPDDVAFAIKANVAVIATLSTQIDLLEKRLQEKVGGRLEYELLTSAPGIGKCWRPRSCWKRGRSSALPPPVISPPTHVASTACIPAMARKREKGTQERQQVPGLAFVEAANFALRYCPEAKRFYERKKAKTNNVVAIKALAHKLARACFHILKEKKPFDVTRCFA